MTPEPPRVASRRAINTPKKITQDQVINQINNVYLIDRLGYTAEDIGHGEEILYYEDFKKTMMVNDFITSAPTLKAKWDALEAAGYIRVHSSGKKAIMTLDKFGYIARADVKKKTKNKKTNTPTQPAAAGAIE